MKELVTIVESMQPSFEKVNTCSLPFHRETEFALQVIENSKYLQEIAVEDKQSLRNAIINVAAIGLSLNPALKLAYLIPRKKVCLDISYIGMVKLATDSGSVVIVKAEIIHKNDKFIYKGPFDLPIFEPDFFGDRGEKIGVWCGAKLSTGEFLVGVMSIEDCHKVRNRGEAWKAYLKDNTKSNPWLTDESEMMKKTIIKRESKLWPKTERLAKAIEVLNEHEGIDFSEEEKETVLPSQNKLDELKSKLAIAGKTEKALLASLPDHNCQTLSDLNADQVAYSIRLIDQLIANKKGSTK